MFTRLQRQATGQRSRARSGSRDVVGNPRLVRHAFFLLLCWTGGPGFRGPHFDGFDERIWLSRLCSCTANTSTGQHTLERFQRCSGGLQRSQWQSEGALRSHNRQSVRYRIIIVGGRDSVALARKFTVGLVNSRSIGTEVSAPPMVRNRKARGVTNTGNRVVRRWVSGTDSTS